MPGIFYVFTPRIHIHERSSEQGNGRFTGILCTQDGQGARHKVRGKAQNNQVRPGAIFDKGANVRAPATAVWCPRWQLPEERTAARGSSTHQRHPAPRRDSRQPPTAAYRAQTASLLKTGDTQKDYQSFCAERNKIAVLFKTASKLDQTEQYSRLQRRYQRLPTRKDAAQSSQPIPKRKKG